MDVYTFFKDSIIALVIGNRTVCKVNIPTDIIMAEIFQSLGYEHLETVIREIPSKRLPKKSSPSNVRGDKVDTMNREFIVILKRT